MEGRSPSDKKGKKAKGKSSKGSVVSFYTKRGESKSSRWLPDGLENYSDDSCDDPSYVDPGSDSESGEDDSMLVGPDKVKKKVISPRKNVKKSPSKSVSASVGGSCEPVAGPSGIRAFARTKKIIPTENQEEIVGDLLAALSDSDTIIESDNDTQTVVNQVESELPVDLPHSGSVDAPRSSAAAPDIPLEPRPIDRSSGSDHSDNDGPPKKKGRRRVENKEKWFEKKNKDLRNSGQQYISARSRKVMPARQIGTPCKDGCFEKLGMEKIQDLFNNFWSIGDYNKENEYLINCIEERSFKRKYTKKEQSIRPTRIVYKVTHSSVEYEICRQAFMAIFGLKRRRIEWAIKKMKLSKSQTGVSIGDQRGKTRPPANKFTGESVEFCHKFIQGLPVVTSHYTRAKAPLRQYLPSGGSLNGLYNEYWIRMQLEKPHLTPFKENYFRKFFTSNYNIDFAPPKTDECNTCCQLDIKINVIDCEEGEKESLKLEKDRHLADAKTAQKLLKDPSNFEEGTRAIAIDLQQQQPCPKMPVNKAFYTSKLYFLNFCIYDITKDNAHMYVWDESVAKRGPNEIGSCILKWLNSMENEEIEQLKVLRIFADNCAGQNKNIFILVLLLQQLQKGIADKIELIFLVSGHSFMPCDRAFGVIEKVYRKIMYICSIPAYVKLLESACKKNKYSVVPMTQRDFYDVKELEKCVTNRSKGNLLRGKQFVLSSEDRNAFKIKFHYSLESIPEQELRVDLLKGRQSVKGKGRGRPSELNLQNFPLRVKYTRERLLKKKKILSMETLQDMIPLPVEMQWYKAFIARQKFLIEMGIEDVADSDQEIDEDPDNPENNNMFLEESVLVAPGHNDSSE